MATKDKTNKIEVLICHGVEFNTIPDKGTACGNCPFCGKENHFFCNVQNGKWQCKICLEEGNAYTFMSKHYDRCLKDTKKGDYELLSSQRNGLPWQAFRDADLAYDRARHVWLFPIYNDDKAIANLLRWDGFAEKPAAYSTPTCKQHFFRGERIKSVGPIWVCEGPWDEIALDYLLEKAGLDPATNSIVGSLSASMSIDPLLEKMKGREVYFLYDNDPAGIDGQHKQAEKVKKVAKAVHLIHWPSAFPEKYDLRDFIIERIDKPKKCYESLMEFFKFEDKVPRKDLPKVPTFDALVRQFRKILHLEQNQLDALAVCVAVVASAGSRGTPLWLFLVGPPGSGKSEMLLAFSQLEERCLFLSRLTSEAFISGFSGEDNSVMSYLRNRTLIIKDFTSVKAMSQEKQVDLFGMLRDAYDGEVAKPFGNDVGIRSYKDCWFPMLAGVTHIIHADNQSAYGERFLKFELLDEFHDVMKQTNAAMDKADNDAKAAEPDNTLKNAIIAFFEQREFNRNKLPKVKKTKYEAKIVALAQIVAIVRTSADRKGQNYAYRPTPENPGRLGSQFVKLSQHLCWVLGKTRMDDEVYNIVRKTATDTVVSWALEIVKALIKNPQGLTMAELTQEMHVAVDTIRPPLETLCQIIYPYGRKDHGPILQMEDTPVAPGSPRMRRVYKLDRRFVGFWKTAELPMQLTSSKRKSTRGPKRGSTYQKQGA